MQAKYDNQQSPVGSIISGEWLKEMIGRKFFPIESVTVDGALVPLSELDFQAEIEDKEVFAVILVPNCNEVGFVQLFVENKVIISTGLHPL